VTGGDGQGVDPEAVEALRSELLGVRDAVSALHEAVTALSGSTAQTTRSGSSGGSDELAHDLAELRTELVSLRRRISLRAPGSAITPEDLDVIADAVAKRLKQSLRPR
jgi:hypothetical protein